MRRAGWVALAIWMALPFVAVGVVVGGVVWYWDLFALGERAHVRKNEEIIDSLPAFPGAQLVELRSSSYSSGSDFRVLVRADGYSTEATYSIPAGAAWDDVLAFYAEELDDAWEVSVDQLVQAGLPPPDARPIKFLNAYRDRASVGVQLSTDGPAGTASAEDPPRQYVVIVDHDANLPEPEPPPETLRELTDGAELIAVGTVTRFLRQESEGFPFGDGPGAPPVVSVGFAHYEVELEEVIQSDAGVISGGKVVIRVAGDAAREVGSDGRILMPRPGDRRLLIARRHRESETYDVDTFHILNLAGEVVTFGDRDGTPIDYLTEQSAPAAFLKQLRALYEE